MQVMFATARGVLAFAVSFLFIDELRANPVEVEADAGVITTIATVEAIDEPRKIVTVRGAHGNIIAVKVGPEHIHKVKLKEKVTVRYSEETAVALRKADGPPQTDGQGFVQEAEAGMNLDAPTAAEQDWVEVTPTGAVDHTTVEISDTVEAVNHAQGTITFAGRGGTTRTVRVPPSLQGDFSNIKKGDRVVVLVTRAVAIDIKPI
jgi:hypothetical protein